MAEHAVLNHGALTRIQQLKQRLSRLSAGQQDSSPLRRDSIELQLRAAEERLLRLRLTAESNQQVLQGALSALQKDMEAENQQRDAIVLQRRRGILEAGQSFETKLNKAKQDKMALLESLHALIQQRVELLTEQLRRSGEEDEYGSRVKGLGNRVDTLTSSAADAMEAREAAFQEAAKKCEARVSSLRAALSAEVSRRRSLASSLREMVETAFYQMQAVVQAEHAAREEVQRQLMDMLEEAVTKLEEAATARVHHQRSTSGSPAGRATRREMDDAVVSDRAQSPPPPRSPSHHPMFSTVLDDGEPTSFLNDNSRAVEEVDASASFDVSFAQMPDAAGSESDAGSFAQWDRRSRSSDNLWVDASYAVERRATTSPRRHYSTHFSEKAVPPRPRRFDSAAFSPLVNKLDAARDAAATGRTGAHSPHSSSTKEGSRWDTEETPREGPSEWKRAANDGLQSREASTPEFGSGYRGFSEDEPSSELTVPYRSHDDNGGVVNCVDDCTFASTSANFDIDESLNSTRWRHDTAWLRDNDEGGYFGDERKESTTRFGKPSSNSPASSSSLDGGALLWSSDDRVLPSGDKPLWDAAAPAPRNGRRKSSDSPPLRPYQPVGPLDDTFG